MSGSLSTTHRLGVVANGTRPAGDDLTGFLAPGLWPAVQRAGAAGVPQFRDHLVRRRDDLLEGQPHAAQLFEVAEVKRGVVCATDVVEMRIGQITAVTCQVRDRGPKFLPEMSHIPTPRCPRGSTKFQPNAAQCNVNIILDVYI